MPTKKLFHSALNPTHCLHYMLPSKKNAQGRCLRFKGQGRIRPMAKTNVIRKTSSSGVCIATPSISQALRYSLHIFINIIIVQHIDFLIRVKHTHIIIFSL